MVCSPEKEGFEAQNIYAVNSLNKLDIHKSDIRYIGFSIATGLFSSKLDSGNTCGGHPVQFPSKPTTHADGCFLVSLHCVVLLIGRMICSDISVLSLLLSLSSMHRSNIYKYE